MDKERAKVLERIAKQGELKKMFAVPNMLAHDVPGVRIVVGDEEIRVKRAEWDGPSRLLHHPIRPDPSHPHVWVETHAAVYGYDDR